MTSLENKPEFTRREKLVGHIVICLTDLAFVFTEFEGRENLQNDEVKRALERGSIIIAYNHPSTVMTSLDREVIRTTINSWEGIKRGVVIKRNLAQSLKAGLTIDNCRAFAITTKKYQEDEEVREKENRKVLGEITAYLKQKGSLLEYYPEGTRNHSMNRAESGFAHLAQYAELVVLVASSFTNGFRPRIEVLQPITGKKGVRWCMNKFGRKAGKQAYSDLAMTFIAGALPEDLQGDYQSSVELAGRIDLNPNLNEHGFTDEREKAFALTYSAFKTGQFRYGSSVGGLQS